MQIRFLQKMLGQCQSRMNWDDPMDLGLSTIKTRARDVDHGQGIPYHVKMVEVMYSKLYILTES